MSTLTLGEWVKRLDPKGECPALIEILSALNSSLGENPKTLEQLENSFHEKLDEQDFRITCELLHLDGYLLSREVWEKWTDSEKSRAADWAMRMPGARKPHSVSRLEKTPEELDKRRAETRRYDAIWRRKKGMKERHLLTVAERRARHSEQRRRYRIEHAEEYLAKRRRWYAKYREREREKGRERNRRYQEKLRLKAQAFDALTGGAPVEMLAGKRCEPGVNGK